MSNGTVIIPLVQVQPLANVETAIFTVPTGQKALIQKILLTNFGNGSEKVTMAFCLRGVPSSSKNYVLYNFSIASGSFLVFEPEVTLSSTDIIRAKTDGDIAITITGNYT
jgi:hypothetical protein